MTTMNHHPSCTCRMCRTKKPSNAEAAQSARPKSDRPTIEKVLNPVGSSDSAALIPLTVRVSGEEQDAMEENPVAYVFAMKERGYSDQEIRNKLAVTLTDASQSDLNAIFESASTVYRQDKGRHSQRILSGTGMLGIGLVITVPLAIFGSYFVLGGVILILAGAVQLGRGIHDKRAKETQKQTEGASAEA